MKALVSDRFSLGPAGGVGMINGGGAGTGDVLDAGGRARRRPHVQPDVPGGRHDGGEPRSAHADRSGFRQRLRPGHASHSGHERPGPRYNGIPQFSVGGYETIGNSETYLPKYIRSTYFTYSLNFGWNKGTARHPLRRRRGALSHERVASGAGRRTARNVHVQRLGYAARAPVRRTSSITTRRFCWGCRSRSARRFSRTGVRRASGWKASTSATAGRRPATSR